MKNILTLFLLSYISLIANQTNEYHITYNGITLGKISDFSTIHKGYIIGKPTNGFLSFLAPFDNYIIHEVNNKPNVLGDNKYKKDKYLLLDLIRKLTKLQPKNEVFLKNHYEVNVTCNSSKCAYTRLNKKKNKIYEGYLTFTNNILDEMCDDESNICFKRIKQI